MTRSLLLLALPLPISAAILGARWMLRCPHKRELFDREDGVPVLRCERCHRVRSNILAGVTPAYRRTQEAGEPSGNSGQLTGIEREQADARMEAMVTGALRDIERLERGKVTTIRRHRP